MEEQEAPQQTPTPGEEKSGNLGPLVGVIIIIAVLVIAGFYYWGNSLNKDGGAFENMTPEEIVQQPDETTASLLQQGTSDEVSAIEGDLQATADDLDKLNAELGAIENEFENF